MATGRITVSGGSGFIGRNLVPLLRRGSATVRVAVRHPDRLRMAIGPAQALETTLADVLDDTAVTDAIARTDAVVNLVGILTALISRRAGALVSHIFARFVEWNHDS
jgi:nucleoside-diphosphate-sugar epimerase